MRTAIYIRVSTEEQVKEGFSIAAQKERLDAYIKSQGWELVSYYVDEGISAKDMNRPELQRMLKNIKEGFIDVVLVYRLDRLTRSVLDLYKLLDTFENHNCHFKSATEVYDTTTAIGRLFITLVAALAQWERENLGERVRMGMTQKVREGQWHGSTPPYGYDYIEGDLVINEEESSIVKKIFRWYVDGMSDRKIAIRLNDMAVDTKKGTGIWRENRIRYLLRNPTYCGHLQWNVRVNKEQYFQVKDSVPPIIDEELYQKAQEVRGSRNKVHPRQATSMHIFSGVLRCARCGAAMRGHKKKDSKGNDYRSYRCINRYVKKCDMPMISENLLENTFLNYFQNIVLTPSSKPIQQEDPLDIREYNRLKNESDLIKKRRKKWQYAWANDMLTDEEYKDRMEEEEIRENEINKELSYFEQNTVEINSADFEIIASYIKENWEELNTIEKKTFILHTIERIVLDKKIATKLDERVKIIEMKYQ